MQQTARVLGEVAPRGGGSAACSADWEWAGAGGAEGWRSSGRGAPRGRGEGRGLRGRARRGVAGRIAGTAESGVRLGQSPPFAGARSRAERRRVYEAFRA